MPDLLPVTHRLEVYAVFIEPISQFCSMYLDVCFAVMIRKRDLHHKLWKTLGSCPSGCKFRGILCFCESQIWRWMIPNPKSQILLKMLMHFIKVEKKSSWRKSWKEILKLNACLSLQLPKKFQSGAYGLWRGVYALPPEPFGRCRASHKTWACSSCPQQHTGWSKYTIGCIMQLCTVDWRLETIRL